MNARGRKPTRSVARAEDRVSHSARAAVEVMVTHRVRAAGRVKVIHRAQAVGTKGVPGAEETVLSVRPEERLAGASASDRAKGGGERGAHQGTSSVQRKGARLFERLFFWRG